VEYFVYQSYRRISPEASVGEDNYLKIIDGDYYSCIIKNIVEKLPLRN
jgi:hypothetical protein